MALQMNENYLTIPQIDNALKVIDKKLENARGSFKEELLVAKVRLAKAKNIIELYYTKTMKKKPELVSGKKKMLRVVDTRGMVKNGAIWTGRFLRDNFINKPVDFINDNKTAIVATGSLIATANVVQHILGTEFGKTAATLIGKFLTDNPLIAAALGVAAVTAMTAAIPTIRSKIRSKNLQKANILTAKNEILDAAQATSEQTIESFIAGTGDYKDKLEIADEKLQEIIETPGLFESLQKQLKGIPASDTLKRAKIQNLINQILDYQTRQKNKQAIELEKHNKKYEAVALAEQYIAERDKLLKDAESDFSSKKEKPKYAFTDELKQQLIDGYTTLITGTISDEITKDEIRKLKGSESFKFSGTIKDVAALREHIKKLIENKFEGAFNLETIKTDLKKLLDDITKNLDEKHRNTPKIKLVPPSTDKSAAGSDADHDAESDAKSDAATAKEYDFAEFVSTFMNHAIAAKEADKTLLSGYLAEEEEEKIEFISALKNNTADNTKLNNIVQRMKNLGFNNDEIAKMISEAESSAVAKQSMGISE